jgi:hypothetical protein
VVVIDATEVADTGGDEVVAVLPSSSVSDVQAAMTSVANANRTLVVVRSIEALDRLHLTARSGTPHDNLRNDNLRGTTKLATERSRNSIGRLRSRWACRLLRCRRDVGLCRCRDCRFRLDGVRRTKPDARKRHHVMSTRVEPDMKHRSPIRHNGDVTDRSSTQAATRTNRSTRSLDRRARSCDAADARVPSGLLGVTASWRRSGRSLGR